MSLYSCQLWDLDSANILLPDEGVFPGSFACTPEPIIIYNLLPAICQNDIRKALCGRIQSHLGKAEASGNRLIKFCSLFVNRGGAFSVCNSKNTSLCTRINHNCNETRQRLGGLIRDFISYRGDVPQEDNLKIIRLFMYRVTVVSL